MTARKQDPSDPTNERTSDQSTQSASGLTPQQGQGGPELPEEREAERVLNRDDAKSSSK